MLRTRIVNADGTTTSRKEGARQLFDLEGYDEKVILIEVKDINKTIQIKPIKEDVDLKLVNHPYTGARVAVIPSSWIGTKVELIPIENKTEKKDDLLTLLMDEFANKDNDEILKKILIIFCIAVGLVITVKLIKK